MEAAAQAGQPGVLQMGSEFSPPLKIECGIGGKIGVSDWFLIDQDRLNKFGEATDDLDPMHVDSGWCKRHSPFGQTIAFGFLTLSLLTRFSHEILAWPEGLHSCGGYALNYGFDHVRFLAPVPVDTRIRCHMTLLDRELRANDSTLYKFGITIEIENQAQPALTADWLALWVAGETRLLGR